LIFYLTFLSSYILFVIGHFSMDNLQFSDDEIKQQLSALGYYSVSDAKMKQFKQDLHKLIEHDNSSSGCSWYTDASITSDSDFGYAGGSSANSGHTHQKQTNSQLSRFQPHLNVQQDISKEPKSTVSIDDDESRYRPGPSHVTSCSIPKINSSEEFPKETQQTDRDTSCITPTNESKMTDVDLSQQQDTTSKVVPTSCTPTSQLHEDDANLSRLTPEPTPLSGRVVKKRKVLRKQVDGTPRVFDESLVEDVTGGRGRFRLHDLSVDDSDPRIFHNITNESIQLPPRPHTAKPLSRRVPPFDGFTKPNQPPSFIRSNTSDPHMRNIRKVDPVNKYHKYKELWTSVKAPGEKPHKELRWEVKAQMMYKEEPAPKPQRVFIPNTYVVPTSKKRSALRWEVRHAMERGLPIPNAYDVY